MGKDPAFLFYDGDAARDVSHMNRLERGCYFDFIQAQKKFGPLTLAAIQKILGKDFTECWPALQMCLTYDKDMYFISWLQDSIEKRQKYSESRRQNKKGSKQAKNEEPIATYVEHMVIENENAIEIGIKKESQISIRKVRANDKVKIIYCLEEYFKYTNQYVGIVSAGWTNFDAFMKANPSRVFDDDDHVYNSFRQFSTAPKKKGELIDLTNL